MRYNFGTSDISIAYNSTKVNDGLWHRVRALRCEYYILNYT